MECVEYNPVNPAPYLNYVSAVEQKRNNILAIIIGILFIGGVCYLVYDFNKKTHRAEKECIQ
jgi:hypothetical protein